jgi:hypothetical protein
MRGWIDDRSYLVITNFSARTILQRISTQAHRQLLYERNKNLNHEAHEGFEKLLPFRKIFCGSHFPGAQFAGTR